MGQTGSSFDQRYKEHYRGFKRGNKKSILFKHLIDNSHATGTYYECPSYNKKGRIHDTFEKYRMYFETYNNNQIKDRSAVTKKKYFMRFDLVTLLENIRSSHIGRGSVASCQNSITCRA
jgi:hypothetical protein